MKMFLSFVKLQDETIHVGLSEMTEDRFAHSDSIRSADELKELATSESIDLPELAHALWPLINLMFFNGASLIEFVVEKSFDMTKVERAAYGRS